MNNNLFGSTLAAFAIKCSGSEVAGSGPAILGGEIIAVAV